MKGDARDRLLDQLLAYCKIKNEADKGKTQAIQRWQAAQFTRVRADSLRSREQLLIGPCVAQPQTRLVAT